MSKRMRREQDEAKNFTVELDEIDKLELFRERITAPLIWRRLSSGIKIQDLQPNYYNTVLELLEAHYLNVELLYSNAHILDDPESKASFNQRITFIMKDSSSIIALDETKEDALAGCLIFKAIARSDFGRIFSRVQLIEGEAHKKVVKFTSCLNRKVDIYDIFKCDTFLRYYLLCIHPDYRKIGLGFQLMRTGLEIARTLKIPVVMGIFGNHSTQTLAKRLGMTVIEEVNYTTWLDDMGRMIFCNPGAGNYTCAVMAGEVPPPPEIELPPPLAKTSTFQKLTRLEKRKAKSKQKQKMERMGK